MFVGLGLFIDGEDAVFGACFNGHIGHGEAVRHGKLSNAVARKFQGLVEGPVDANHADKGQHDILTRNIRRFFSCNDDLNGFRYLEPARARCHGSAQVC